jgi:hypothetical protein
MAQTSYSVQQADGFEGLLADARENTIESYAAVGAVPFGYGVVGDTGSDDKVTLPSNDVATIVWDADFVASNSIVVTVNGEATSGIAFDTDQATTIEAVRAAVEALSTVKSATRTDTGGDDRTLRIETVEDTEITVTEAVTGGAGQADGTITESTDNAFRGIAVHSHREPSAQNVAQFDDEDSVSTLTKGLIWVPVTVAVAADDDAYVIGSGSDAGKFTNVSSNNVATGGKFKSSTSGAGIAKVVINLP